MSTYRKHVLGAIALLGVATMAFAHGDVAPQPVNTDALPDVGEEWLIESPYRVGNITEKEWLAALEIGASGYNQNCARCHGLEAVSGGLAPDLRFLEAEEYGDEWYMERYIHGYTQNGVTRMPAFGELLGQKAGWAIRVYIETRPDDEMMAEVSPQLAEIRDQLKAWQDDASGADVEATVATLQEIAGSIETLSGAPVADSVAFRAANILQADPANFKTAADTLTIGLSAAN
ncbi:MAG: cytochrome c-550 PedF [Rhodobacteraceae bacterium]|nr:cytochrome c-550 PedF [Paracoccaceae bacterium]